MENFIQTTRKVAIIIGCAILLLSVIAIISNVYTAYSYHSFYSSQSQNFSTVGPSLFTQIVSAISNFFTQVCLSIILILVALLIDPSKIVPVFENKQDNDIIQ